MIQKMFSEVEMFMSHAITTLNKTTIFFFQADER